MNLSSVETAKWDKGYWKDVWNSLFNADIVKPQEEENMQVHAALMLLETAIFYVKRIGSELKNSENGRKLSVQDLATIKKENEILKEKLKCLETADCRQCARLERGLVEQRKETDDVKQRIQSIAVILGIGLGDTGEKPRHTMAETQTAINELMTEMFTMDKRKGTSPAKRGPSDPAQRDSVLAVETAPFAARPPGKCGAGEGNIVIPETQDQAPPERSPKKETPKKRGTERMIETSPLLMERRSTKRPRKGVNFKGINSSDKISSQDDEDSPEILTQQRTSSPPKRSTVFKRPPTSADHQPTVGTPPTIGAKEPVGAPPTIGAKEPAGATADEKSSYVWKLKPDSASAVEGCVVGKLKQTTLNLKPKAAKKNSDITTLKGFNGGVLRSNSSPDGGGNRKVSKGDRPPDHGGGSGEEDDIVMATPPSERAARQLCKKPGDAVKRKLQLRSTGDPPGELDSLDETNFVPMAASTCNILTQTKGLSGPHGSKRGGEPVIEIDIDLMANPRGATVPETKGGGQHNYERKATAGKVELLAGPSKRPADRGLKQEMHAASAEQKASKSKALDFKYQREAVRKKADRLKLEGWDCPDCVKYFAAMGDVMNQSAVKRHMNRCSRHRGKYQTRTNTPPGFWDPKFASSSDESS